MLTWCSSAVNFSFPFCFAASRTRSSPLRPLSRHGVRCELGSGVFSLVSGLPSTTSAVGFPLLFGCFVGTTPLYDSPALKRRAAVRGGLMAHHLLLPARTLPAGGDGVSRFSRMEFLCMPGVLAQELESAFRL